MNNKFLSLAALCVLLVSCQSSKPPVVYDSRVKIDVMIPEKTPGDDAIYIAGPFTGGDTFSVGNPVWKLQRSGQACTITLDPDNYIGGKTPADGFWFISEQMGRELDNGGAEVVRRPSKENEYVVARWTRAFEE